MVKIELDLTEKEYEDLLKWLNLSSYIYAELTDFVDDKYKEKLNWINNLIDKLLEFTDNKLMKKYFKLDFNIDDESKYKNIFNKWDVLDDLDEYDNYTVWDKTWIDLDEDDENEYNEDDETEKDLLIKQLLNK